MAYRLVLQKLRCGICSRTFTGHFMRLRFRMHKCSTED